jgi:hypothetical protein
MGEYIVNKNPNQLWIIALLLGCFFDFLFWGQTAIGVNFAIFTSLCLMGGFYLLLADNKKPSRKSLLIFIPLVFFSLVSFFRKEPLTLFLAYTFSLFLMGVFTTTYLGGRWMQYSLPDYIQKFVYLVKSMLLGTAAFHKQMRSERSEQEETKRKFPIVPILRGMLIALPIVACFASLLASADMVFSQKLADFMGLFDFKQVPEYTLRLLIILFWAYVLAGSFLHAAAKSQDEKLIGEEQDFVKPFIGLTESVIVLGSVSILFFSFILIQFRYFFGGDSNIGIDGYTYSQYARQGFNELVVVAFFSLLLILGFSTITKREVGKERRIFSGLNMTITIFVMVILVSAYQRLLLAVDWHGFSRLRVYPQVFLIWIGILLVAVAIIEFSQHERYFTFAVVFSAIGFAVSLTLFNVDDSIVRHNILRASQGKHFNPSYLASLSLDAVPALADKFQDLSLPEEVHEGIGAALLCHRYSGEFRKDGSENWQAYNFSRAKAKRLLESLEYQLEEYKIIFKRLPYQVRTPSNKIIDCVDTSSSY